ncbi:hypothetical protein K0T92_09155 [Paenibacillus oenotherae]|uniref:Lipoprotein n=1 Tax=Paenibacillus oenotherae TaxID=1435645 RepID=A0ABS7D517_9BACL|nr:hypothetical protein [Paenibacillus oenotherae]MBW7474911.1 hypothetical protein [Paenibacillus oenotherae]
MRGWHITLALIIVLLVAGCSSGSGNTGGNKAGSEGGAEGERQTAVIEPKKVEVADLRDGVKMMSSLTKDFKQAVEADDEKQRKELVAQIAGVWEAIKADLKVQSADTYPTVEGEMAEFLDSASGDKIDKELVIQQDYKLYQRFRDLGKALEQQPQV